jgi:hypothetical protein
MMTIWTPSHSASYSAASRMQNYEHSMSHYLAGVDVDAPIVV